MSLSGDGNVLGVGAPFEDSGVRGQPFDNSAPAAGAVYLYERVGSAWAQRVYLKASNPGATDFFGSAIDLSNDGSTLAVGALEEDSSATGVNGDQTDNSAPSAGAVYVYVDLGAVWAQQAYIKASNADPFDRFGTAVALSGNGAVLAVGAAGEDSGATGVDGNSADNGADNAGAVYVFGRAGSLWAQKDYIKASNAGAADRFGHAVALSNDGATLVVGAHFESGSAVGINGDETNDAMISSGAAYVLAKNNGLWTQRAYVKASNTMPGAFFGASLAVAGNGGTIAVAAPWELSEAGAVYVY